MLEELPTEALCTDVSAICELTPPRELIAVNDDEAPTQLITNELCKLEKLSFTLSFAKNISVSYTHLTLPTKRIV